MSVEAAIGFTAPLPLLIGINDVFRSRDKGLFELEMACKFTGSELLLAKLFLIGLYNFLLIVLFCFGLTIFDFTSASWRLLFDGMASFLGLTGISLYFALRFRAAYVSFLMFLLWSFSILALEVLPFLKEAYLFVRTPFTFFPSSSVRC
ncbi:hypothetical protein P7H20_12580 [Paenibacillus larvae]|nr:hypothetical protein [Paenibacillus larvae]MDT2275515.1 hypothetical protein [Paenibacillus larvae]